MFSAASFLRKKRNTLANDHGFNDAWLDGKNNNPYPVGSRDHKSYEDGFKEGQEEGSNYDAAYGYYPSNEYEGEC